MNMKSAADNLSFCNRNKFDFRVILEAPQGVSLTLAVPLLP